MEKETARRAKLEKEQEQRVNRMNMSFFANISHEFRTPLTMISGPVTQLCESPKIEGENKQLLYIVQRSVGRMLRLVNQLMDFNPFDPESVASTDNFYQGIDYFMMPALRNIGFSLSFKF